MLIVVHDRDTGEVLAAIDPDLDQYGSLDSVLVRKFEEPIEPVFTERAGKVYLKENAFILNPR